MTNLHVGKNSLTEKQQKQVHDTEIKILLGLFEKWSTLDPKNSFAIPFQKFVFLVSSYPEFLEKKTKK